MKTLEAKFVQNADKTGDMTFTKVKREGNVAMYHRTHMDGRHHSYEVFVVQTVKQGAKLPNGETVAESYERYCTANSKHAYFCTTLDRANVRFVELMDWAKQSNVIDSDDESVVKTVGRRGRRATVRPSVVTPKSKKWTMKDLLKLNPQWSQPVLYIHLMKHPESFKQVGSVPAKRGKPATLWSVVGVS